jgi:dephospho-CoA kinase
MSLVVGLTGGIGSGKSAAADCFARHGAAIVDTDAIAHQLTSVGGSAIEPIRATFGPAVLTPEGALDRAEMRRRVFADPAERARLEALLHPLIRAASENQLCRAASADFSYAVLVVPLLIETGGYRERVDRVCVVDCPDEIRIARVMERSGLTREDVQAIMAVQASRADRLAAADDVIDNAESRAELARQVEVLHALYLKKAAIKSAAEQKMRFNSELGAIQG